MRVIKAKLKGKPAHLVSGAPERGANVVDLMERLRQSLEASGGKGHRRTAKAKASGGKRKSKRPSRRHAA